MASRPEASPGVAEVRAYWERHPLYSHEVTAEPGSEAFFQAVDRIKREDVERFALAYWDFAAFAGKAVLDIGCGPGWLTVQYARAGAHVTAVDLTDRAVALTRAHLAHAGLRAEVRQANAEALPFGAGAFDLVVASGVLHHTEDTPRAVREARRVTRDGGAAKITLYHKGLLHGRAAFPLVRLALRTLAVRHPGARLDDAATADELIRRYDGSGNPIGRGYTTGEARALFASAGFTMEGHELHFFPQRLLPSPLRAVPGLHRLLDGIAGTMIYPRLRAVAAPHRMPARHEAAARG